MFLHSIQYSSVLVVLYVKQALSFVTTACKMRFRLNRFSLKNEMHTDNKDKVK